MRGFILRVMIGCLVLGLGTIGLFSQAPQPEVSLDDHPSNLNVMPFGPWSPGAPWVAPYMSAEDEFGLGLPASAAFFVGPSPTLLSVPPQPGPFNDSDILVPGPALFLTFPPPPFYMDAISCDHSSMVPCGGGLFVRFSVDRATGGVTPCALPPAVPVPPYDASYLQAWNNEQPGDIYRTDRPYAHVGNFTGRPPRFILPPPLPVVPPGPPTAVYTYFYGGPINAANGFSVANGYPFNGPAGTGGPAGAFNQLMFDHQGTFNFLPLPIAPPPPPNQPQYPTITPGSHDNIDAFNEWPFSLVDPAIANNFFSLHPASALPMGFSGADIFICPNPPGIGMPPAVLHVPAGQMGLDTFGFGTDSIDGLAFWDNGIPGVLEPGTDYVAFSLAPGSATLQVLANPPYNFQVSAASVFVSDFQTYIPPAPAPPVPTGYFYLWLYATDMGVGNLPNVASFPAGPLPVINPEDINIDALDLTIDPEPVPYINPITNPITDPVTKK
jgi:hypothetical protein